MRKARNDDFRPNGVPGAVEKLNSGSDRQRVVTSQVREKEVGELALQHVEKPPIDRLASMAHVGRELNDVNLILPQQFVGQVAVVTRMTI